MGFRIIPSRIGQIPFEVSRHGLRIWIKEQLIPVEPMSGVRLVGAVNAVQVELTRLYTMHIYMPDITGTVRPGIKVYLSSLQVRLWK